jgi:hypothetical protein
MPIEKLQRVELSCDERQAARCRCIDMKRRGRRRRRRRWRRRR